MRHHSATRSRTATEVRFWACFAVVFALLSQVLFPPQVMAQPTAYGTRFVLCTDGTTAAPVADEASVRLFKSLEHKKSGTQGLKCSQCVVASITSVAPPATQSVPAVYTVAPAVFAPLRTPASVKARAPPRPHSCGPPSQI